MAENGPKDLDEVAASFVPSWESDDPEAVTAIVDNSEMHAALRESEEGGKHAAPTKQAAPLSIEMLDAPFKTSLEARASTEDRITEPGPNTFKSTMIGMAPMPLPATKQADPPAAPFPMSASHADPQAEGGPTGTLKLERFRDPMPTPQISPSGMRILAASRSNPPPSEEDTLPRQESYASIVPKKSKTGILIGGAAAIVALIALAIFLRSGESKVNPNIQRSESVLATSTAAATVARPDVPQPPPFVPPEPASTETKPAPTALAGQATATEPIDPTAPTGGARGSAGHAGTKPASTSKPATTSAGKRGSGVIVREVPF